MEIQEIVRGDEMAMGFPGTSSTEGSSPVSSSVKRKRMFQAHWKESWPWLVLKEIQGERPKMFCDVCLKYPDIAISHSGSGRNAFVNGCDQLRIESIRAHETSKAHMACFLRNNPGLEIPFKAQRLLKLNNTKKKKKHKTFRNEKAAASQGSSPSGRVNMNFSLTTRNHDAGKRKRMFQAQWKESWPWLVLKERQGEEPKMFCNICLAYPDVAVSHSVSRKNAFLSGCNQFRIEPIRAHEKSKSHTTCVSLCCEEKHSVMDSSLFKNEQAAQYKQADGFPGISSNNQTSLSPLTSRKDKKYDSEKRKRVFQAHWKKCWSWLFLKETQGESPKMYCSICLKYPDLAVSHSPSGKCAFLNGCDQFRVEPIKAHETSKAHKMCILLYNQEMKKTLDPTLASNAGSASPTVQCRAQLLIVQALQKLKEIERKRLMVLFTNAYCIAKQGMPLSDMDILCSAMKTAGVDLGDNYTNREKASEFIKCEAEVIRQDIKDIVLNSRFVCIVADGSTDNALVEQETVLVRVVNEGKPYTVFADLVPLYHKHAPDLMDGIVNGIKKVSLDLDQMKSSHSPGPTLVSVNFDGAPVMMESKGGVAAMLKHDIPFLLPFYCVTHKLQLGILDVDLAMKVPVTVTRLPRGPDGNSRGFDLNTPRGQALGFPGLSASRVDTEDLKRSQKVRAVLREHYLRSLLAMAGKMVCFTMYEKGTVEARFGTSDIDILNFQVYDLQTPLGVQKEALIRCSDVISYAFEL
ncbi:gem-associated protein 7 [Pleurodeles waltl]